MDKKNSLKDIDNYKNRYFKKLFFLIISRSRQVIEINKKSLELLINDNIGFDVITLFSSSPFDIEKFHFNHKKIKSSFFREIKQIFKLIFYDIFSATKIIIASLNSDQIIISARRWAKKDNRYSLQISKALKIDSTKKSKFVYVRPFCTSPFNVYLVELRSSFIRYFLKNFYQIIENYQKQITLYNEKNKLRTKIPILEVSEIDFLYKIFYKTNKGIYLNKKNLTKINFLFLNLLNNLYDLLSNLLISALKNKEIYIINTNLWTVGNLLSDYLITNNKTFIYGCQHGAGYNEKIINPFCDYEESCPAFEDFIGFGLFSQNIDADLILNMKTSNNLAEIIYIQGTSLTNNKLYKTSNVCLENLLKKICKNYKCAIRVHPRESKKFFLNQFKTLNINENKYNIEIFKSKNKLEGFSKNVKICIFDNPHSTLFWQAKSNGIKTILLFEDDFAGINKSFINLFDFLLDINDKKSLENFEKYLIEEFSN